MADTMTGAATTTDLSFSYKSSFAKWIQVPIIASFLLTCMLIAVTATSCFFEFIGNDVVTAPRYYTFILAAIITALCMTLGYLLLVSCRKFLSSREILVGASGLSFPAVFLFGLHFRHRRLWSDLLTMRIQRDGATRAIISFASGGQARIEANRLEGDKFERLMVLIRIVAPNCKIIDSASGSTGNDVDILEQDFENRLMTTAFRQLQPGDELQGGNWKVIKTMASGGVAAVYLVQDRQGDLAVLKESFIPDSCGEKAKQAVEKFFAREASLLSKLEHPQIVKLRDFFVNNDRHYLAMDYVPGVNLRSYVNEHGLQSEEKVFSCCGSLLNVLKYLHGQPVPIIHRDLSPENVILKPDGSLILIDFGVANYAIGNATGTVVGKQSYVAIEQFKGKATTESDLYGLGCIAYFLLCGEDPQPLGSSSPKARRSELSEEIDQMVRGLTADNASERVFHSENLSAMKQAETVRQAENVKHPENAI